MHSTLDSAISLGSLLLLLAKSTAVLCLAYAGTWLLRRRSGAARHGIWAAAMAALLVITMAAPLIPWKVVVPAPSIAVPAMPAAPRVAPSEAHRVSTRATDAVPVRIAPPSTAKRAVRAVAALSWSRILLWVWGFGIALVSIRQIVARVQLSRLSRRAAVADEKSNRRFERIVHEAEITRPVTLLVSEEVDVPLTWGMFNARVLLPRSYGEWEARRFDNVLRHELAHVRRLDVFTALLADVACALYWYNPLAWMAATQMRVEREIACDEVVLAAGAKASDYASDLLDLAINVRFGSLHRAGLAIAGCPRFEQRVKCIVDAVPRVGLTRMSGIAVWAGVLAVLPLAAFQMGQTTSYRTWPIPSQKVLNFQHDAVAGEIDKVIKAATEDPSMINVRGREGQTALSQALVSVSKNAHDEALWLIQHGAEIDPEGSSLLPRATRFPDILRLMLDRGADVNAADRYGRTALDDVLMSRPYWPPDSEQGRVQEQATRILLERGAKLSFISAIKLPDVDVVRKYLTDDPSLAQTNWFSGPGSRPLYEAVTARRMDRAKYQPVVDLVASYLPEPTLCEAAMLGRTDLVARKLDADPAQMEKRQKDYPLKPLDCALLAGERGTMQYLLNRGAKIEGRLEIREAIYTDADTMRLLIAFGAAKDMKPETLELWAQWAEKIDKKDVAEVLRAQK